MAQAKNTVNYRGFRGNAVTLGWELSGRRLGRRATITFGYQPKASGKGTGVAGARILGCMLLGVEVMSSMILSSKGAAQEARAKREREHGRGKVCETRLVRVEIAG